MIQVQDVFDGSENVRHMNIKDATTSKKLLVIAENLTKYLKHGTLYLYVVHRTTASRGIFHVQFGRLQFFGQNP